MEIRNPKSREDVNHLFSSPHVRNEVPSFSLAGTLIQAKTKQKNYFHTIAWEPARATGETPVVTPAEAFWRQREMLANSRGRILSLSAAIGRPTDLTPAQWAQIMAFTEEFRPDLILELGRGTGNSTACFTEVAQHLGGAERCKVLSLCLSDTWRKQSVPKIRQIVPPEWFAPLEALECDILSFDIGPRVASARRIMVFWDAHGFELAEWVLGELLPKIARKPHIVMMHDLSDLRYCSSERRYGNERLWKGTSAGEQSMWLGHIHSRVAQSISILDFTSRNKLPLHSGDDSFFQEIGPDLEKKTTLERMLGNDLFQLNAHRFWFTLAEAGSELTYPKFEPPPLSPVSRNPVMLENNELAALRKELNAIQCSGSWRLLNKLHRVRNAMAPAGSLRRKVYDSILKPFRGRT